MSKRPPARPKRIDYLPGLHVVSVGENGLCRLEKDGALIGNLRGSNLGTPNESWEWRKFKGVANWWEEGWDPKTEACAADAVSALVRAHEQG